MQVGETETYIHALESAIREVDASLQAWDAKREQCSKQADEALQRVQEAESRRAEMLEKCTAAEKRHEESVEGYNKAIDELTAEVKAREEEIRDSSRRAVDTVMARLTDIQAAADRSQGAIAKLDATMATQERRRDELLAAIQKEDEQLTALGKKSSDLYSQYTNGINTGMAGIMKQMEEGKRVMSELAEISADLRIAEAYELTSYAHELESVSRCAELFRALEELLRVKQACEGLREYYIWKITALRGETTSSAGTA